MKPKHEHVHLRLDVERDTDQYPRKRFVTRILKCIIGGSYLGTHLPDAICGARKVKRLVDWKNRHDVTCPYCQKMTDYRFPSKPANPRSGMRMPKERHQGMIRAKKIE